MATQLLPRKGAQQPPIFRPMYISVHVYCAKRYGRSPISTTAEVLYVYTIRFHNLQYNLPFSTGVRNIYAEIILIHMARAYVDMVAYVVRALSVET